MLLFYCLVSFPMMLMAGVISIEYQRVLTSARTAALLADSAAAGAVLQFVPNGSDVATYNGNGCFDPDYYSMCLDKAAASAAASDVVAKYSTAITAKEGAVLVKVVTSSVQVTNQASAAQVADLTVTITYQVPTVGFLALTRMFGANVNENTSYTVTSRAYVCEPGRGETANGECVRLK
jgi:hypothetical protein